MQPKSQIQRYINNFRRRISRFLRPGIGLSCSIFFAQKGGAILEFKVGPELENDDSYQGPFESLGKALSKVDQRAFGGNLDGFLFSGTNVIMEPNRFIFIKDESPKEWSDKAAEADIQKVIHPSPRRS